MHFEIEITSGSAEEGESERAEDIRCQAQSQHGDLVTHPVSCLGYESSSHIVEIQPWMLMQKSALEFTTYVCFMCI